MASLYSDRGTPETYEITWQNGHVETIQAHQVTWPGNLGGLFGRGPSGPQRIQFHAEIDGHWSLQLSALEEDIRTVRNITADERIVPAT